MFFCARYDINALLYNKENKETLCHAPIHQKNAISRLEFLFQNINKLLPSRAIMARLS
jgi:hypothetical protein